MKKRITSLILAVMLLVSAVPAGVSAQELMAASEDAIQILKKEEGFSAKPYWDYAQWTVGYGTKCPDDKLEEYKNNGITEEAAQLLLQSYIEQYENELHKFMSRTGVVLTQNQFDALLLFSYNCGTGWSYSTSGVLYQAIVGSATGNELINAFSRWCNAGGQIKTFLLRRRLCEANMYLNGIYAQTAPDNYGYVLYDPCGGTVSPNVQGYDTALTAAIIPTPTYEGYTFEGWYTAQTGGTKVTVLNASVKNARLYAHWADSEGNDTDQSADGVTVTVTANNVNLRQGAGTNHAVVGSANTGDQLVITETAEGTGYTWGKSASGWICLKYTNFDTASSPKEEEEPKEENKQDAPAVSTVTGTVKVSDFLRIRSGPSTGYSVAGYLHNGDKVEILEQKIVGSMVWGRISDGWISLSYVTLDAKEETPKTEDAPQKPQTVTGTVKVNDFLRVRSGPSTSSSVVGYLSANAKVEILEQTTSGSMTWGKISDGWISMDYVVLDSSASAAPQKVTGTVKVNDYLRVRSGPGTSYAITAYLSSDAKVEITEQKAVGGTTWGKCAKGWISLDYVVLDGQSSAPAATTKTVTADCLRIRSAAGTSNKVVGYLYAGAKVEILETKTVNGTAWGRTAKGWISLDYVK